MRSKSLLMIVVSVLASVAVQGCSSDPPKNGVPIQTGDYTHAPGGGNRPNTPGAGANANG